MKQEAWVEDKVDEVIAKKVEKAEETKQKAEYAPTINTCVPILKNKIPNKFAKVTLTGTGLRSTTWRSADTHRPQEHQEQPRRV